MRSQRARGLAFIAVGIALAIIGSSGQRAFLAIGAAFMLLGLVSLLRSGRRSGPD